MSIWVIGGDARSFWTAERLRAEGREVKTYGVPNLADTPLPARLEQIVLPFPSFQGALLRGKAAVPAEEVLCRAGGAVFGGCFGAWGAEFATRGVKVHDLYGSEPLTTANAVPTAEGAIQLAMERSPVTLHGASCLIIGYGRIGKVLALKLRGLDAAVTVAARRAADRALAEAAGLNADETGVYRRGLAQYDFLFNTVPAPTLTEEQLRLLSPDCVLIELASLPGGIPAEVCQHLGLSYVFAPGLPGKCAPKAAGSLYAQSVLDILAAEEGASAPQTEEIS